MNNRMEDKIRCVDEWHDKSSSLKQLTKPIIDGYIKEIKLWKEQHNETKFSLKLYETKRKRKIRRVKAAERKQRVLQYPIG